MKALLHAATRSKREKREIHPRRQGRPEGARRLPRQSQEVLAQGQNACIHGENAAREGKRQHPARKPECETEGEHELDVSPAKRLSSPGKRLVSQGENEQPAAKRKPTERRARNEGQRVHPAERRICEDEDGVQNHDSHAERIRDTARARIHHCACNNEVNKERLLQKDSR